MGYAIIWLAIIVLMVVSLWKVYTKAGQPGWASIIPIYNMVVLLEIAGKPLWWIVLFFIPVVNLIVCILVWIAVAENFGQGTGFGVGLALLGIVFIPVLAFGGSRYAGAAPAAPPVPPVQAPPPAQAPPPMQEPPGQA